MSSTLQSAASVTAANEEGRRQHLVRFGYDPGGEQLTEARADREWSILKADFATAARQRVPDLAALEPATRAMAGDYIHHRRRLDLLLDACDAAHSAIRASGAGTDLVEQYADARDAFEDAVEEFGALRIRIEGALINR